MSLCHDHSHSLCWGMTCTDRPMSLWWLHMSWLHHVSTSTLTQWTKFTNPIVHLSHIPQCTIQNRNVHISVLNAALWDMGQVHCGICEIGSITCVISCNMHYMQQETATCAISNELLYWFSIASENISQNTLCPKMKWFWKIFFELLLMDGWMGGQCYTMISPIWRWAYNNWFEHNFVNSCNAI